MFPSFAECLKALRIPLLSAEEDKRIFELFENNFPLTNWGKIDWIKIHKKSEIGNHPDLIISTLEKFVGTSNLRDQEFYILWDDASVPLIKAPLSMIVKNFDDVTCVGIDTFIFNPFNGCIIERRHGGFITVGV